LQIVRINQKLLNIFPQLPIIGSNFPTKFLNELNKRNLVLVIVIQTTII